MAMVTSLAPIIGYDRAAEIAKESAKTGKTVRQLCMERLKKLNATQKTLLRRCAVSRITRARRCGAGIG